MSEHVSTFDVYSALGTFEGETPTKLVSARPLRLWLYEVG